MSGKTILWSSSQGDITFPMTPTSMDGMTIGASTPAPAGVTNLSQNGIVNQTPQLAVAAGSNSQANATLVTKSVVIITTVSSTTRALRLPTNPAVGDTYDLLNDTATTAKVYPGSNATIGAGSTNANTTIAGRKGTTFRARSATHWVAQAGA